MVVSLSRSSGEPARLDAAGERTQRCSQRKEVCRTRGRESHVSNDPSAVQEVQFSLKSILFTASWKWVLGSGLVGPLWAPACFQPLNWKEELVPLEWELTARASCKGNVQKLCRRSATRRTTLEISLCNFLSWTIASQVVIVNPIIPFCLIKILLKHQRRQWCCCLTLEANWSDAVKVFNCLFVYVCFTFLIITYPLTMNLKHQHSQ